MWHIKGGEDSLKFQFPSSYGFGVKVFEYLKEKDKFINQLMFDKLFC